MSETITIVFDKAIVTLVYSKYNKNNHVFSKIIIKIKTIYLSNLVNDKYKLLYLFFTFLYL